MTSQFFSYDKKKVIQALRYHFITRPEIKVMMILVNVFSIVAAAFFYFKKISPRAFLVSSVLWISMMAVFWFILPNVIYRKAITFKDRFKASFDDRGFTIENDRGHRTWSWKELSTWMESPHFFHLYFNARSFFIVPKEAFIGDEVHEARRLLEANIRRS